VSIPKVVNCNSRAACTVRRRKQTKTKKWETRKTLATKRWTRLQREGVWWAPSSFCSSSSSSSSCSFSPDTSHKSGLGLHDLPCIKRYAGGQTSDTVVIVLGSNLIGDPFDHLSAEGYIPHLDTGACTPRKCIGVYAPS